MTLFRFGPIALVLALLVTTLAGCAGIPQDGRYQDHDGGRSNTRAEAAPASAVLTRLS